MAVPWALGFNGFWDPSGLEGSKNLRVTLVVPGIDGFPMDSNEILPESMIGEEILPRSWIRGGNPPQSFLDQGFGKDSPPGCQAGWLAGGLAGKVRRPEKCGGPEFANDYVFETRIHQ